MNKSRTQKIIVVALLILIVFIGYIMISYYTRNDFVKNCYYTNQQDFDNIAVYFENLYSDNLYSAEFDADTDELILSFKITDENNESSYSSEIRNCSNESFSIALDNLRAKYQGNSDYPVFYGIYAYYDNGHMLLHICVQSKAMRKGLYNTGDIYRYYIVYIDEEYNGNYSKIGIDSFNVTRDTAFSGNWCYWSKKDSLG